MISIATGRHGIINGIGTVMIGIGMRGGMIYGENGIIVLIGIVNSGVSRLCISSSKGKGVSSMLSRNRGSLLSRNLSNLLCRDHNSLLSRDHNNLLSRDHNSLLFRDHNSLLFRDLSNLLFRDHNSNKERRNTRRKDEVLGATDWSTVVSV